MLVLVSGYLKSQVVIPDNLLIRIHSDDGIEVIHGCTPIQNALMSYTCSQNYYIDNGYLTKCLTASFYGTGSCAGYFKLLQ